MQNESGIKILKGSVLVYRVFDIGGEVSLSKAEKCLSEYSPSSRFELPSDIRKAIIIKEAPLFLKLGAESLELGGRTHEAALSAKIWDYGVLSVTIQLPIPESASWEELVILASQIENSKKVDELAINRKEALRKKIIPAVQHPGDWKIFEDYVTYFIEKVEGVGETGELLSKADVPSLILAEDKEPLSGKSRHFILENALQYSKNDLAVIDWNSALIVSPDGQRDVADVVEFCLTHLLEMRYYDDMLEEKLFTLYDTIESGRGTILSNFYSRLSEDASRKYIEFSEFLGRVENSLKTVGDSYLATVFRMASHEFRFKDWRQSIARKMETLARLSELLQGELNTRRSHLLEIIIILLIAVELVPFFKMLFP